MNNSERFTALLNGRTDIDRTPIIEWASWWDETCAAWFAQGLERMEYGRLNDFWGHDKLKQFWLPVKDADCPKPAYHGGPIIEMEKDYAEVRKHMYTDRLLDSIDRMLKKWTSEHAGEDIAYWFSLDGYFWFPRTLFGIEGILPLERMAGVDVNRIREKYPELIMVGGFDKTVMHLGEESMRKEFERILPAIRSGRYIPSVDHQTPPDVTIENYRIFMRLLREYSTGIGK